MEKYVILHGHFYQPPREDPWTGLIEVQESAAPYSDWNRRITAECYAAGASSRILDSKGAILSIKNNYSHLSFNFGPTLLAWVETEAPQIYQRILDADRLSVERLGHGNALAQSYNHTILPLDTPEDALTQIRWGISDFTHRFK
ncbi:MAG: glycoside hydrolase, partial [Spirochaetaceae bacterium]|nr:glycoside hydrolase [Spirochaetaceae bacterium]